MLGLTTPQGGESFGFVRIDEGGKVTLLHDLSPSEGAPVGATRLVLAAANLYGVGSQSNLS